MGHVLPDRVPLERGEPSGIQVERTRCCISVIVEEKRILGDVCALFTTGITDHLLMLSSTRP